MKKTIHYAIAGLMICLSQIANASSDWYTSLRRTLVPAAISNVPFYRLDGKALGNGWPFNMDEPLLTCTSGGVLILENDDKGVRYVVAHPQIKTVEGLSVLPLEAALKKKADNNVGDIENAMVRLGQPLCANRNGTLPANLITPERFDGIWPFNVDRFNVVCAAPALFVGANGTLYRLNGTAMGKANPLDRDAKPLAEIHVKGISVGDVIKQAAKICGMS